MKDDVFFSMIFSICLLMALAYIIGKWDFMKKILRQRGWGKMDPEQRRAETLEHQIQLGLIMGLFCVVSNTIGFLVDGSIPNSRVIGAMSAGLLGGPVSGFLAAGIGAVHRYLGEPDRISTTACCLATLLQGGLGSLIWYGHKKRIDYSSGLLFLATMLAECVHMGLIYLLSFPRVEALAILNIIAVPMVLINPVGMVLFFAVIRDAIRQADREEAAGVSRSLRLTERCVPYLQACGDAEANAAAILKIIVEEEECEGAAFVRDDHFLARTEAFQGVTLMSDHLPDILNRCRIQNDVVAEIRSVPDTDPFAALAENYVVLAAPVPAFAPGMDYLVVLVRKSIYSSEADQSYVSGLARFFTIQLTLSQLEEQKNLLRKAELQTLQSQINPHFLFNALNTISFFCREKPERARELLMDLSTYFRNTLQDVDSMVTLGEELAHVQAYLSLEQARFEDRLRVTVEAEEAELCVLVPNLILQPLVENAIRHGAMTQSVGRVIIRVRGEGEDTVIEVRDNGGGVPEHVVCALTRGESVGGRIGLLNVQKRLLQIWGESAGLAVTREDGWTCVRTRIAHTVGACRVQAG